jgi:hypothetical protein
MTNEEALKYLKPLHGVGSPAKYDEALEMAIKAIELQGDLVAALAEIARGDGIYGMQAFEYKQIAKNALVKAGVQS